MRKMDIYFSDYFAVDPAVLDSYGAFNISLVADLPLFVDPFLLFNSRKPEYQRLHQDIIRYLTFLRDKSVSGSVSNSLIDAWYRFGEVRQNWLGFTRAGNAGSGLGRTFATALSSNLNAIFNDFGSERVTKGSHLEKLCLITGRVGRDNISDFTTNLIKGWICEYTAKFARRHIASDLRRSVSVPKTIFNYETESWEVRGFELPWAGHEFILLTPKDMLTKDDTWINKTDLISDFPDIPASMPDGQLKAQVSNYFEKAIRRDPNRPVSQKDRNEAARRTILKFPEVIDHFIRLKEQRGEDARLISADKVRVTQLEFIDQVKAFRAQLHASTAFYRKGGGTYEEAHERVAYLKDVIENKGGHRIFYVRGKPIQREEDVHTMFRLVWAGTVSDVSREVNDGRGPADFKISRGVTDKTIVEFKLAKNTSLEKNLRKQAEIYQKASDAKSCIKVIVYFSDAELSRVMTILERLRIRGHRDVVLIDAQSENKPSGSKA